MTRFCTRYNFLRKFCLFLSMLLLCILFAAIPARAAYVDTNLNTFIHDAEDTQIGYIGQDMQFHVRIGYNGVNGLYNPPTESINNVRVRLSNDQNYLVTSESKAGTGPKNNPYDADSDDESAAHDAYEEGWKAGIKRAYNASLGLTYPIDGGKYPFEINASVFSQEQSRKSLKKGEYMDVIFNVTIRSDAEPGYYGIPVTIWYDIPSNSTGNFGSLLKTEFVNVYIRSQGEVKDPKTTTYDRAFAIGENQQTPQGRYGTVMNYGVNFRNTTDRTLYDVKVAMSTSLPEDQAMQPTANAKASAERAFPFEISQSNYDQTFTEIASGQTITAPYSMTIKRNAAPGYYPILYIVSYKQTPGGTVTNEERYTNFVKIDNDGMIDQDSILGEFSENNRTKARLIVQSFHTDPEVIYAGQPFTLYLTMANASQDINASNILFSLESEKANNSAVFNIAGGANSIVVNQLAAGKSKDLTISMVASAGVDPRSYTITVNEKYDSPQFKNASEKVTLDINVNQVSRLSCSNFSITPESVSVGNQADIMFGINNTGKVTLYNVEAVFEADSIGSTSTYVGNIKPGETGNVDVMVTGTAPTNDDGKIPVTIKYEDVNGNPFTSETSVNLYVTEPVEEDYNNMNDDTNSSGQDKAGWLNLKTGIGALVILGTAGFGFYIFKKKHRKKDELNNDEII